MKFQAPSFSPQYLKQVHEEWLYVQATHGCRNGVRTVNDPASGESAYTYRALPASNRETGSQDRRTR